MPKIEIIAGGIFGADKELAIGEQYDVDHVPPGWAEKVRIISGEPIKAQGVTNPAKSNKRKGLEKQAEGLSINFTDETTDEDLLASIKTAKAQG